MTEKKKILIIDDEPELVQLLTLRFESEGYQLSAVSSMKGQKFRKLYIWNKATKNQRRLSWTKRESFLSKMNLIR